MIPSGRDGHGERASAPALALHLDATAVQPGHLVHETESYPGALASPAEAGFDLLERVEQVRQFVGPDAGARVADPKTHAVAIDRHAYRNLALERELEGIGDKAEHDVFPHAAIHVHRLRERRAVDDEPQADVFNNRAEDARDLRRQRRQIRRFVASVDAAGFETGEIEQGVDELEQSLRATMQDLDAFPLQRRERVPGVGQRILRGSEHEGERRPKLLADIPEEDRLGAVELRQRLCTPVLILMNARVGNRGGDMCSDRLEERPAAGVNDVARCHACDQDACNVTLAGNVER